MQKSILKLELYTNNGKEAFRTIFKNQHGRVLYLSIEIDDTNCSIIDCFYIDRNQGRTGPERCRSKPLKLQTVQFHIDNLLHVIKIELDKKFYDVEIIKTDSINLTLDQYLQVKSENLHRKYHFLIMVGSGDTYNGLPICLRTRLKNKLHRSIFIELQYYKEGRGVVNQCYYYDRKYKRQDVKITPPLLKSCFFPYTQEGILNLFNHEICCDFTHMIITDGIDLYSNTAPLCGAI